jgi:membrane protease YdiL (CAAX protease family)
MTMRAEGVIAALHQSRWSWFMSFASARAVIGALLLSAAMSVVMVSVESFFEEILVRGIVLKAFERPLGSLGAVLGSSLLFGMLHIPNAGATMLSTLNVTVAGVMFGTAFIATRRLWLCIGLHFGWNFTANYVFSAVVSGHDRRTGLIFGSLSGPDWITGRAFGIEGSVVTLVALLAGTLLLAAMRELSQQVSGTKVGSDVRF